MVVACTTAAGVWPGASLKPLVEQGVRHTELDGLAPAILGSHRIPHMSHSGFRDRFDADPPSPLEEQ
jgi:hypothetical protein